MPGANSLVALNVNAPPVDAMASFGQGVNGAQNMQSNKLELAQKGMSMIGSIALGVMDGKIDGTPDPQRWEHGLDMLAQQGVNVDQFRGKPQMAPLVARASIGTLGQLQQAQNQQQFDRAMQQFGLQVQQASRANAIEEQKLALETKKVNYETSGAFRGDSMETQSTNILLRGDPASPEYAAAYNHATQPKTQLVQGPNGLVPVQVTPTLPQGTRPPTYKGPGQGLGSVPQQPGAASPGAFDPNMGGSQPSIMNGVADASGGVAPPAPASPGSPNGISTGSVVPGTTAKPTEQQMRAREIYHVAAPEIKTLEANWAEMSKTQNQAANGIPGMGNIGTSEGYQQGRAALKTIIASYLYVTSGMTAAPGEVENQTDILTPKPFEKAKSIADKLARVKRMIEAIQIGSTTDGALPPASAAPTATPDAATGGVVDWTDPSLGWNQ